MQPRMKKVRYRKRAVQEGRRVASLEAEDSGPVSGSGVKRTITDFFGLRVVGARVRKKIGRVCRDHVRAVEELTRVPGFEHENAGTATSCISGAGLGLFVYKAVKEGGFICSYTGRVISLAECLDVNNKSEYCTTRGDGMIVDAAGEGWGPGKYANDAGNVLFDNAEIREGAQGYGIYALVGCGVLESGSEVFVAYDGPYFVDRRFSKMLRSAFAERYPEVEFRLLHIDGEGLCTHPACCAERRGVMDYWEQVFAGNNKMCDVPK